MARRPVGSTVDRSARCIGFGTDPAGALICGFHAPGSWEEIVGVSDCLLASERGNEAREAVLAWARDQGLTAFDRRSHARATSACG